LFSLSSIPIHESPSEVLWQQDMINDIGALQSSGSWELIPLPVGKSIVSGCRFLKQELMVKLIAIIQ